MTEKRTETKGRMRREVVDEKDNKGQKRKRGKKGGIIKVKGRDAKISGRNVVSLVWELEVQKPRKCKVELKWKTRQDRSEFPVHVT